ncbi:amine dehydrogenase large subunit [Sphingomonas adhaesiva]|uniref:amine dehydrogenase large subunit n=1 Tax=Sphingomonas adhaesiva TaxID=28212 RepID=UPI002FF883F3
MRMFRAIASAAIGSGLLIAASAAPAQTELQPEVSDTMRADPPQPDWFFVDGGWDQPGTSIFDGRSGKMKGMVETSRLTDFAIDPAGKYYYVAESIWSHRDRGTRQDMVSVYDARDMKLQAEIAIPGRILIGARKNNFVISDDGRWAYVYNLDPASSVNVVDLAARKFRRNVELPGCASLMPNPGVGFSALCSDGSIATVDMTRSKPAITRTAPFFKATDDPIFDNYAYDAAKKRAVFLTYTGLVYTATVGAAPVVAAPFSIQAAAGMRPGETTPLEVNWLPGGRQPMALHRPSGHLFVLMHMGEYWSHKASGTEVWDVDLATQKVVKRFTLDKPMNNIEVSQTATPMLYLDGEGKTAIVVDAVTGERRHEIKNAGGGVITVVNPY